MPSFGVSSTRKLNTCDERLQKVLLKVVEIYDITIITGHRNEVDQNVMFAKGPTFTKVQWPNGKHNTMPSKAADIAPWPIDWYDLKRFYYMAGLVLATAESMGIKLRWGGDWDMDGDFKDQTFNDLVHFELVDE